MEYLGVLHILGNQVSCSLPERAHLLPSLPFIPGVPTQAFLVALDVPGQIEFYQGFRFPNLIPGCLDNFCVFLQGYLSLFPPSVGLLFVFEFVRDQLVRPC